MDAGYRCPTPHMSQVQSRTFGRSWHESFVFEPRVSYRTMLRYFPKLSSFFCGPKNFLQTSHQSSRKGQKACIARILQTFLFCQRIAKGAGGKGPRQKTSKIVKKCQKYFRHFSTIFAQGRKRQKSSKSVKKFFDTFRQFSARHLFSGPFCNPLILFLTNSAKKMPQICPMF